MQPCKANFFRLFINTHTHKQIYDAKIELVSLPPDKRENLNHYSYGLHPWSLKREELDWQLQNLSRVGTESRCLAIGECGLDKVCAVDLDLQLDAFNAQVQLANRLKKPLLIHCVKAFNELLNCLTEHDNKVPVIIHGFNNNENIANLLLDRGYILSFGKALLAYDSNASKVIRKTGRKQILLETDDSDISIKYIYHKAADLLGIDEEVLKQQLQSNFESIFKLKL